MATVRWLHTTLRLKATSLLTLPSPRTHDDTGTYRFLAETANPDGEGDGGTAMRSPTQRKKMVALRAFLWERRMKVVRPRY